MGWKQPKEGHLERRVRVGRTCFKYAEDVAISAHPIFVASIHLHLMGSALSYHCQGAL